MATLAMLVLGLLIVQTDRGRAQASGTQSELADDALGGALWHIAVNTQSRIGFESVEFVRLPGQLKHVPTFPVSSRDEALNAAVEVNPRYEWRAIGDVAVVRPKSAWNDPVDPFNRPVRNLRVENAQPRCAPWSTRFHLHEQMPFFPGAAIPVSFDIQSGTVVGELNRPGGHRVVDCLYRPNAPTSVIKLGPANNCGTRCCCRVRATVILRVV
jgi:hypothetical protein